MKVLLGKASIKNGIWMYFLQFFNAVLPLMTLPYITRILGAEQYGVFSIALNIVNYLQVLVEYGFGMSATRKIALAEKRDLNKLFSAVLYSRGFLLFISAIISLSYNFVHKTNTQLALSLAILLICLLGYCVQMDWVFQGKQEMKYISIVNIISRTVSVIGIFTLVTTADDLYLYCLLYAISPFLSGFIGLFIAKKKYSLKLRKLHIQEIYKELQDGWFVFTTQLSSKVFGAIGVTLLGIFALPTEVGIFSAIQKIPNIMILAWTPISQVIYPISSKHFNNSWREGTEFVYKVRNYILPFFFVGALLVNIFSRNIILILFGTTYAEYFFWVTPLLLWLIVAINNNFMGVQILLGSGHDKEYSECFQIGVVCTILFNFGLIYFFKGTGAAIAPLVSEGILGAMLYLKIKKISKQTISDNNKIEDYRSR